MPIIPNTFDYERFFKAKKFDKYNDSRLTILFLNRLVPRKGASTLLKAILELSKQNDLPPFKVIICGKGPEAESLQQFIDQNGLSDTVEMVGFVSEQDKPRYYASADIAVFPSSGGESFGIVLLEAMANGKTAVLAGDNPGYRSVMSPHPELLFPPKDYLHLAKVLGKYLMDEKLRLSTAKWGSQYTRSFDTPIVGKQLEALYREALRGRPKQ